MTSARLRDDDIEAVRVPLEAGMVKLLRTRFGDAWSLSLRAYEHVSAELELEADLRGLVLDASVIDAAEDARRALGVERDVEVHASHHGTACAHRAGEGPFIVSVDRRALAHLDRPELVALVGHELGHHLTRALAGPDPRLVRYLLQHEPRSEMLEIARAACRARELTADRFALLACGDVDTVVALFARLSDDEAGRGLGPHAYLAAAHGRAEELLARRERAAGDTHPELAVRAHAVWLFSQTNTYRRMTGAGPRSKDILDVNMELAQLVGPAKIARDDPAADEPSWFEDVGEAIYERSAALGRAVGEHASRLVALALGRGAQPPDVQRAESGDDAVDIGEAEIDDLEQRFRDFEAAEKE